MKNTVRFISVIFLGFLLIFPLSVLRAEEQAHLRLPWDHLQKLLKVDKKEVRLSWEDFQILLKHTSPKRVPTYSVSGGDVVMTKEEFKTLLNQLIPPKPLPPSTQLTKSAYKGILKNETVKIQAKLTLYVHNRNKKPMEIDVFPGNVVFHEVELDGKPALIQQKNGRLWVTTTKSGFQTLDFTYSVSYQSQQKTPYLSFPIVPTPITLLEFDIPEPDIDVTVPNALQKGTSKISGGTRVNATLPPSSSVALKWNPVIPDKLKGPAKIYSDQYHHISIEGDAVRVRSSVQVQVLKNTIRSLTLGMPAGFSVLEVEGPSLGEWEYLEGEKPRLKVPLQFAQEGRIDITVITEKILFENKTKFDFSGIQVEGAIRDKGYIGVELKTSAEVSEPTQTGLERVDPQELPPVLLSKTLRPLLYAYKYIRHPFTLEMGLERHEDVSILSSVVDLYTADTWLTHDGKMVHQLNFHLRNTSKQFLELTLPAGVQLWSVFVEGKPVKPTKKNEGSLLIPLSRSQGSAAGLKPFEVKLVYFEEGKKFFLLGRRRFQIPAPDLIASQVRWSFHTPQNQTFSYFGKEWKKEKLRNSFQLGRLAARAPQSSIEQGNDLRDGEMERLEAQVAESDLMTAGVSKNMAMKKSKEGRRRKDMDLPAASPAQGQRGVMGVLPIHVLIPVQGNTLTLTKTLVEKNKKLMLPLIHYSDWLINLLKWLLIFVLLLFIVRRRAALLKITHSIVSFGKTRFPALALFLTPFGLLVTMTVLTLAASYISTAILFLAILGFLFALTRWLCSLLQISKGDSL